MIAPVESPAFIMPGPGRNPAQPAELTPPQARAEGLLRSLENVWLYIDRLTHRFIAPKLNPFGQLGAMANTSLIIAVISGIALLIWYSPSVHHAHESLEAIRKSSWLGQWVRSMHRYSSDGCLFFVLLHALRIICQRRFTGPRWLAWVTGVGLLSLLWFIGWTGYWLVWDVRGQHAALGTTRFIDALPIFAEPLGRSFLTDKSVPSLLFFVIFFIHMLSPLAIGVGIWMHLMRVNRARFLTGTAMTLWLVASLGILALLAPAISAGPAAMTVKADRFTMDWWYLWPIQLTDRLGGGALWGGFVGVGIVSLSVPWWMAKRRALPEWKAQVELARCIGCSLCAQDCPFNAITMIPREDGKKFDVQSFVNPDLCVSCGICTGSCDSYAINLPALNVRDVEKGLHAWIDGQKEIGQRPFVAFCCGESTREAIPGYYTQGVPCVGWVSAQLLERALQRGAEGVLVVGCGEGDTITREGIKWFGRRMEGKREPAFNPRIADPARVRFVKLDRTRRAEILRVAAEFQRQTASPPVAKPRKRALQPVAAIVLSIVIGGIIFVVSDMPYRTGKSSEPELVVSFIHKGAVLEARALTKEERESRLPHMRAQANVSRKRAPVRLRVRVDGKTVLDQSYRAKGISKDGASTALVRLPMSAGTHRVQVELADTAQQEQWAYQWDQTMVFEKSRDRVVLFDAKVGFSIH